MAFTNFLQPGAVRRNIIPATIAVAIGAVAWVGIGPILSGGDDDVAELVVPEIPVAAEQTGPTPGADRHPPIEVYPWVLVAANDMQPGVLITGNLVEWREWREPLDMDLAVVRDVVSLRSIIGAVAQRSFREGDLIAWDGILTPGNPGFISAALTPGMLGVTIEVDRATTEANIIYPGDRVDVIMVSNAPAAEAVTVVRNSRVLAVGSTVLSVGRYGRVSLTQAGQIEPVPQPDGSNYTLEVRHADAQRIAVASTAGRLTLAMRSIRATSTVGARGTPVRLDQVLPPEESAPAPPEVRVFRGTERSVVSIKAT